MERTIPMHIEKLIHDLESGTRVEKALMEASGLLPQDITLLHIYLQLGYCLQSNSFLSSPSPPQVLSLLAQEYMFPLSRPNVDNFLANTPSKAPDTDFELRQELLQTFYAHQLNQIASGSELGLEPPVPNTIWDFFAPYSTPQFNTPGAKKLETPSTQPTQAFCTPSSFISTPEKENEDTPRSARGLKHLTYLVKQLVCTNQPTSFKDVACSLIEELIQAEGPDRTREEKNVRRRVYDAINVLIAAGVLERDGRTVSWKDEWDAAEVEEKRLDLLKKKKALEQKKTNFQDTLKKFLAVQNLIHRNAKNGSDRPAICFPFIVMSTEDSTSNSVSIHYHTRGNALQLKCAKPINLFGDMDILLALNMHKVSSNLLNRCLPSRELLKYCHFN